MVANTKLLPNNWRHSAAQDFLDSVTLGNNQYYFFIGDHTNHSNNMLQPLEDNIETTLTSTYRNMIEGKRIGTDDVALIIRNIPYQSAKVFEMYDDQETLAEKDFYAIVNATSFYHVFKCLDNNFRANSTIEPNFSDISGANTEFYQTSDGYVWKYMYSVDSDIVAKFATSNNFPVVANNDVTNGAKQGAIDVIKIENGGLKYNNYLAGTWTGTDIQINGDPLVFGVSNSNISSVNGFYTGCLLYISSGTGVGQYRTVVDYYSNTNGNYVRLNTVLEIVPENGSVYQIYPQVNIIGTGAETVNAVARALVNAVASNSIYKIEMLNRGADYEFIQANVIANNVVGVVQEADIRPIYGPNKGHGFNAARELNCSKFEISVQLSNSESNTILTTNKFQQFGVLKNPLFANVVFHLANVVGEFISNENFYKIKKYNITKIATADSTTSTITASDGDFVSLLNVGDFVYLTTSDNASNQLGVVNSITNSSVFDLTTNAYFDSANAYLYAINVISTGVVSELVSIATIRGSNVSGSMETGDFIIGERTGTIAYLDTIKRNDVFKGFDTFIQLYKYNGTISLGTFEDNEVIYQGNLTTSNALLHSAILDGSNTILYTSNQVGVFEENNIVVGNTSGAILNMSNAYSPEIVYGSGKVIYLENISDVSRQDDQTEKFKIAFNF